MSSRSLSSLVADMSHVGGALVGSVRGDCCARRCARTDARKRRFRCRNRHNRIDTIIRSSIGRRAMARGSDWRRKCTGGSPWLLTDISSSGYSPCRQAMFSTATLKFRVALVLHAVCRSL